MTLYKWMGKPQLFPERLDRRHYRCISDTISHFFWTLNKDFPDLDLDPISISEYMSIYLVSKLQVPRWIKLDLEFGFHPLWRMSERLTLQPPLFAEATSTAHLPFHVQNLNNRNWTKRHIHSLSWSQLNLMIVIMRLSFHNLSIVHCDQHEVTQPLRAGRKPHLPPSAENACTLQWYRMKKLNVKTTTTTPKATTISG